MEVIKIYTDRSGEHIAIVKAPNEKFFIYYGWNGTRGNCTAGPFTALPEAESTVLKHRPTAIEKENS